MNDNYPDLNIQMQEEYQLILIVLYGGKSVEHDISLKTAFTVLHSLHFDQHEVYPVYITREGYWCLGGRLEQPATSMEQLLSSRPRTEDAAGSLGSVLLQLSELPGPKVALPLLHGSCGEDGTVQGLLELIDVAYVGNGVLGSAAALDKSIAKALFAQAGIPQARHLAYRRADWAASSEDIVQQIEHELGYPCYIKPASLGSSIGISRCLDREQVLRGIHHAFEYDRKIVVEEEIAGREIQVAVLGNEQPAVSVPGEFIQDQTFFDYDAKYFRGELTMSIPADISAETAQQIERYAVQAYKAMDGAGLARVDFFVEPTGQLYLNEINTLPGFTNCSMYPVMWERTDGTSYAELIDKLIDYAVNRHADKQSIRYER